MRGSRVPGSGSAASTCCTAVARDPACVQDLSRACERQSGTGWREMRFACLSRETLREAPRACAHAARRGPNSQRTHTHTRFVGATCPRRLSSLSSSLHPCALRTKVLTVRLLRGPPRHGATEPRPEGGRLLAFAPLTGERSTSLDHQAVARMVEVTAGLHTIASHCRLTCARGRGRGFRRGVGMRCHGRARNEAAAHGDRSGEPVSPPPPSWFR